MLVLIVFLSAFAAISGEEKPYYDVTNKELCLKVFEDFIKEYNKVYESEEEKNHRFEIFVKNLAVINERNAQSKTSIHDVNLFSDLESEEFIRKHTGFVPRASYEPMEEYDLSDISLDDVPDSFDWDIDRKKVSKVKQQGFCGACWAFSAIANVESQYAIKHGEILDLSEQQLVSCDDEDEACAGGEIYTALEHIMSMGGVESEQDYPYVSGITNETGDCKLDKRKIIVKVTGRKKINLYQISEDELRGLLYKNGPISIAVAAEPFHKFHEGVMDSPLCDNHTVNHAVLLVGYGVDDKYGSFWRIKNSWGNSSGEEGYYRIKRGINCVGLMNDHAATCTVE